MTASPFSATDRYTVTETDHERKTETPATRTPRSNWAWSPGSGHFDWMDWHTLTAYANTR